MFNLFKKAAAARIPLDDQLRDVQACGIAMRSGITKEHLLISFTQEEYEKEPYALLLQRLGGEVEEEPFEIISDQIWDFDAECIEDHGAYVRIAERMSALAGSALPISAIEDYVDIEEDKAWLAFELDGKKIRWDARVDNDWADPAIAANFDKLLAARASARSYYSCDLGQNSLMVCTTAQQVDALNGLLKGTNMKFTKGCPR